MSHSIHIPAREGRGIQLAAGTRFRAIDVQGRQAVDLFAFCAEDTTE